MGLDFVNSVINDMTIKKIIVIFLLIGSVLGLVCASIMGVALLYFLNDVGIRYYVIMVSIFFISYFFIYKGFIFYNKKEQFIYSLIIPVVVALSVSIFFSEGFSKQPFVEVFLKLLFLSIILFILFFLLLKFIIKLYKK